MSCDICGRGACDSLFHSIEEQVAYAKVIEAFERARELRREVRERLANQDEAADD